VTTNHNLSFNRQITKKSQLLKAVTRRQTKIAQNKLFFTKTTKISRAIDKRATNEVISQLVQEQRKLDRDKKIDKNNYDSDDSDHESDNGSRNKAGSEGRPQFTTIA
jgi:hypothetical protein